MKSCFPDDIQQILLRGEQQTRERPKGNLTAEIAMAGRKGRGTLRSLRLLSTPLRLSSFNDMQQFCW